MRVPDHILDAARETTFRLIDVCETPYDTLTAAIVSVAVLTEALLVTAGADEEVAHRLSRNLLHAVTGQIIGTVFQAMPHVAAQLRVE